jgi:LPXTG-motif cell wall-anchored protein
LFTIGGVGDSSANPTIPTSGVLGDNPDDELYSISPFVSVGSTQIEVQTRNASNDDNVFFVGFNLKRVALTDAPTLANTGIDGSVTGTAGAIAVLAALVGAVALTARRRRA